MIGWIKFGISAAFTLVGLFAFLSAAIGVGRFGFCLNRLHAAAVADTVGIFCITISAVVYIGMDFVSLKELVVLLMMLLTSPVCSHLLAELEYTVSGRLCEHCRIENENENETEKGEDVK